MLRIIAGDFKGRRLQTPPDAATVRPLPDRVRTSVFNMLVGHFEGQSVFDGFAGSGSFGLEAVSRGASRCVMVEQDRAVADLLGENAQDLGAGDQAEVVRGDVLGMAALARCPEPVHIVFLDPPYPMMRDSGQRTLVFAQFRQLIQRLDATGFALIRTPWPFLGEAVDGEESGPRPEIDLRLEGALGPETHTYGSTAVHWYMRDPEWAE